VKGKIRDFGAYVGAGALKGRGRHALRLCRQGILLLSAASTVPVAYLMAKRAFSLRVLFHSFPYTSEQAKEK
jgi:hypothetical protein